MSDSEVSADLSDENEVEDSVFPIIQNPKVQKYHLRLKNLNGDHLNSPRTQFDLICNMTKGRVILCFERSVKGVAHTHTYIESELDIDELRKKIKETFYVHGPNQYYLAVQRSENNTSYIVKDGTEPLQRGFTPEEMEDIIKASYKKYDKAEFMKELGNIDAKYFQGKISDVAWIDAFVELKAKYKQAIRRSYIMEQFTTRKCRKDPNWRKQVAKSIYDDTMKQYCEFYENRESSGLDFNI